MKWNELNIKQKADVIKAAYKMGYRSLGDIKTMFSQFDTPVDTSVPPVAETQPERGIVNYSAPDWGAIINQFYNGGNLDGDDPKKSRGYRLSSWLMRQAQKRVDDKDKVKSSRYAESNPRREPDNGMPQATFLMNRDKQREMFLKYGYTEDTTGNYGPVSQAVNSSRHKDVPIYQTADDVIDDKNLQYVGTGMSVTDNDETEGFHSENIKAYMVDPSHFPTEYYIDRTTGRLYNKGYDFNDYHNTGNDRGKGKIVNAAGNLLDKMGNPVVVTTGMQDYGEPITIPEVVEDELNRRGLHYGSLDGEYRLMLKPVTIKAKAVKPKEKKAIPTHEEFKNMTADEFFDWEDNNSMQDGGDLQYDNLYQNYIDRQNELLNLSRQYAIQPYYAELVTQPYLSKGAPISHSALHIVGPERTLSFSRRMEDPGYNLFSRNCADLTGEILGYDTSGLTTPNKIRKEFLRLNPGATSEDIGKSHYDRIAINKNQYDKMRKFFDREQDARMFGKYPERYENGFNFDIPVDFYDEFGATQMTKQNGGDLGIITPYGQWQYPHQVTTIPSNNITMKGVNYPVIGVSNTGDEKLMLPNSNYKFNGDYVTEYPLSHLGQEGMFLYNKSNIPGTTPQNSDATYFRNTADIAYEVKKLEQQREVEELAKRINAKKGKPRPIENIDQDIVNENNTINLGLWAALTGVGAGKKLVGDAAKKGFELMAKAYNPYTLLGATTTAATSVPALIRLGDYHNYMPGNQYYNNGFNWAEDALFASPAVGAGLRGVKNAIGLVRNSNLARSYNVANELRRNIDSKILSEDINVGNRTLNQNIRTIFGADEYIPTLDEVTNEINKTSSYIKEPQLLLPQRAQSGIALEDEIANLMLPEYAKNFELMQNEAKSNLDFLNKANNFFYNYPPIMVEDNQLHNTQLVNDLIKDRFLQHNTFLRGVRDPYASPHEYEKKLGVELNKKLIAHGIEPTRENRLKWAATRYVPETGSGRAGFTPEYENEGSIYVSNSLNTAKGHATTHDGKPVGEVAIVRRPFTLGEDRNKWFEEGDFSFRENKGKDFLHIFAKDQMRDVMRTQDYKNIDMVRRKDATGIANANIRLINGMLPQSMKIQALDKASDNQAAFYAKLYSNANDEFIKAKTSKRLAILDDDTKQGYRLIPKKDIDKFGYFDKYFNFVYDDPSWSTYVLPLDKVIFNPSKMKYLMKKSKLSSREKSNIGFKKHKEYERYNKNLFYDMLSHDDALRSKIIDEINIPDALFKYKKPKDAMRSITTSESSEPSFSGNDYQHYIFTGPIDEQGLEFVDFMDRNIWLNPEIKGTRMHTGKSWPDVSHKTFKVGGALQ